MRRENLVFSEAKAARKHVTILKERVAQKELCGDEQGVLVEYTAEYCSAHVCKGLLSTHLPW